MFESCDIALGILHHQHPCKLIIAMKIFAFFCPHPSQQLAYLGDGTKLCVIQVYSLFFSLISFHYWVVNELPGKFPKGV